MASKKKDITLRDVINHMDHSFGLLQKRMDSTDKKIGSIEKRLVSLEKKVAEGFRKVHDQFQHLYTNRLKDLKRVGKAEDRLDHIENKELPAIKSHIGFASS